MMRYDIYVFSKTEWIICIAEYILLSVVVSFLFYDSIYFALIMVPFMWVYIKRKKRKLLEKRSHELKSQFVQMIASMSTALSAGFSVENSLKESFTDMKNIYEGEAIIINEMKQMLKQIHLGIRIEEVISDFAERTGLEEIIDFARVFEIAKKSGGRFVDVYENCVQIIRSGMETEAEIQILISGKKFEQRIMNIIPFALIAALRITSPDMIGILYHNLSGIIIMTICLCVYCIALLLAEKISDIRC